MKVKTKTDIGWFEIGLVIRHTITQAILLMFKVS